MISKAASKEAATSAPFRVLGIDPGTRRMGYAVVERQGSRLVPLAHGVVAVGDIEPFEARLLELSRELQRVVTEHQPTCAAIEEVFFGKNARSALRSAEGRGAVLLTLAQAGLAVHEYPAKTVKRAVTGQGGADKAQVVKMVMTLLALRTVPSQDAADALAVAICHLQRG